MSVRYILAFQVKGALAGLPDFPYTIYQNGGKYTKLPLDYQIAIQYNKWPDNIPNGHKIDQHFPFQDLTQILIFGLKICIPSGNPES
jgi:hypothetical protein